MLFSSLLAAGAFATQSAAFLVPLEIANAAKSAEEAFRLSSVDQKSSSISIDCPGCYFDTADDRQVDYASRPENKLALEFTVDDHDNSLALNGQKFYPLEFPYPLDLHAPLVRSANGVQSPPINLGFALEYLPFHDASEGTIVPIRLTIVDLEGVQVKVPAVTINVIKLSTQELLIARVDTTPFEETPGSECETSICRIKALALARLREMIESARAKAHQAGRKMGWKGCGGHRKAGHHEAGHHAAGHHGAGHHEAGDHGIERPGFKNGRLPGHRRPPPFHHRQHPQHHGLVKFFHKAMHLFIIPAMLGIIGGLTASAIGMFIGQLIVFVWFRFVRGGQRGSASARSEIALGDEKESLIGDEDHELPPGYEESDEVVITDEKI